MNWIAIGILALLAISMLIHSRQLRVLVGTAAVAVVGVLAVLVWWGTPPSPSAETDVVAAPRPGPSWKVLIKGRPNLQQTAEAMSERVLQEVNESHDVPESVPGLGQDADANPSSSAHSSPRQPNRTFFILTKANKYAVFERIKEKINELLARFSGEPGVNQLRPEDLNWSLLKWVVVGQDEKGRWKIALLFDEAFHRHVRERGIQELKKERLRTSGYASAGSLALLTTLFGFLKLKQSRREPPASDRLRSSGVSMV